MTRSSGTSNINGNSSRRSTDKGTRRKKCPSLLGGKARKGNVIGQARAHASDVGAGPTGTGQAGSPPRPQGGSFDGEPTSEFWTSSKDRHEGTKPCENAIRAPSTRPNDQAVLIVVAPETLEPAAAASLKEELADAFTVAGLQRRAVSSLPAAGVSQVVQGRGEVLAEPEQFDLQALLRAIEGITEEPSLESEKGQGRRSIVRAAAEMASTRLTGVARGAVVVIASEQALQEADPSEYDRLEEVVRGKRAVAELLALPAELSSEEGPSGERKAMERLIEMNATCDAISVAWLLPTKASMRHRLRATITRDAMGAGPPQSVQLHPGMLTALPGTVECSIAPAAVPLDVRWRELPVCSHGMSVEEAMAADRENLAFCRATQEAIDERGCSAPGEGGGVGAGHGVTAGVPSFWEEREGAGRSMRAVGVAKMGDLSELRAMGQCHVLWADPESGQEGEVSAMARGMERAGVALVCASRMDVDWWRESPVELAYVVTPLAGPALAVRRYAALEEVSPWPGPEEDEGPCPSEETVQAVASSLSDPAILASLPEPRAPLHHLRRLLTRSLRLDS